MKRSAIDSERLEETIGRVLRVGVTASSVCLAIGLALYLATSLGRAAQLLLNAGLIILMATPVGRVVISIAEYVVARDWVFVLLTSVVLLELLASVVAAFR